MGRGGRKERGRCRGEEGDGGREMECREECRSQEGQEEQKSRDYSGKEEEEEGEMYRVFMT